MILIYKEVKSVIFGGRESENNKKGTGYLLQCVQRSSLGIFLYPCFMKPEMMEISSVFHFHLSCFVFHSSEKYLTF